MHDRLTLSDVPKDARGIVLMLHGGAEYSQRPVDHRSLALRRTRAMFRSLTEPLNDAGYAVGLLRFVVKGWNAEPGGVPSPVRDARLALRDLHTEHPDLPVLLLGHSMGARTSVAVADEPGVVGVVGLAPWFPADEPITALTGKHLVTVHGSRDRITSPKASRIFTERAASVAASVNYLALPGRGHYMLSGAGDWNRIALTESLAVLENATCAASRRGDETA
ncbi:alpha-beta hydrolase superfamily lysophospholipase [Marmoricola sp. OAE513]|uniref:alpha/beta hydrolase n=1 Tax=Marmoricola sp. OAE513 TaxID=2817894 RepID=UPI001AEB5F73